MNCLNCQETMKYKSFGNGKMIDVGRKNRVFASGIYYCDDCGFFVWEPKEIKE